MRRLGSAEMSAGWSGASVQMTGTDTRQPQSAQMTPMGPPAPAQMTDKPRYRQPS